MGRLQDYILPPDTRANQPSAASVGEGALYFVTDESVQERSNGTIWETFAAATGSGDIRSDGSVDFSADQSMGGFKLTNLDDPSSAQDAATKSYVDGIVAGINAAAANVATTESTSATSYGDLATSGPEVTLTTGANVIVVISANADKTTVGNTGWMSVAVSGASSVAASDSKSASQSSMLAGGTNSISAVFLLSGLTPGSNTFTAKYKGDGGTWSFRNRSIAVIAL